MKKNIILLLVLLIIWWTYFLINYLKENSREKNNNSNIDISFSDFSYDKIKLKNFEIQNKKVIYTWTWEFEQDNEKVNKFIEDFKNIQVLSLVSTNKENFDNYWVNNSWSILKLWDLDIYLWNIKWFTQEQYIKIDWKDKVFLVNNNLNDFYNKDYDFFEKEIEIEEKQKQETLTWTTNVINWSWIINNNE